MTTSPSIQPPPDRELIPGDLASLSACLRALNRATWLWQQHPDSGVAGPVLAELGKTLTTVCRWARTPQAKLHELDWTSPLKTRPAEGSVAPKITIPGLVWRTEGTTEIPATDWPVGPLLRRYPENLSMYPEAGTSGSTPSQAPTPEQQEDIMSAYRGTPPILAGPVGLMFTSVQPEEPRGDIAPSITTEDAQP